MQQAFPDDGYTPEDHDIFMTAGRTCVEEGNSAQVLSIILDDRNQVYDSTRLLSVNDEVTCDACDLFSCRTW